jgi:YVTN family beta-propeller protein
MPFVIRWRRTFGVLAGATALALYQPAAAQQSGAPAGRIAIASKAPGVLTMVGLQGQPAREFKVGYLPHEAAAAGSLVFVSNYGSAHVRSSDLTDNPGNTLSVVDLSRLDAPAQAIDLGPGRCAPHGLSVSRDQQRLYVTCEGRQEVLVVDVTSRRILHAIPTPVDGRTLVVNCADNSRVLLVDASTLNVTHEIPVGTMPIGIAVPDDRFAYAANMGDDTISVIDIRRGIVVRTIPAGDDPDGIVFLPG